MNLQSDWKHYYFAKWWASYWEHVSVFLPLTPLYATFLFLPQHHPIIPSPDESFASFAHSSQKHLWDTFFCDANK